MLTRLLESQPKFARIDAGTAASVAIHLVLIAVAASVTTAHAIMEQEPDHARPPVFIYTRPAVRQTADRSHSTSASSAPHSANAPVPVPLAINSSIPYIKVELAVGRVKYPASLRAIGIKGRIVAQFVVDAMATLLKNQ